MRSEIADYVVNFAWLFLSVFCPRIDNSVTIKTMYTIIDILQCSVHLFDGLLKT